MNIGFKVNSLQILKRSGISKATFVNVGFMGDSDTDDYHTPATAYRGGATYYPVTYNYPEILREVLGATIFNTGPWEANGEPRRTGRAWNFARTGCVASSVFSRDLPTFIAGGQHTGLATYVASDAVDTLVVRIGVGDYSPSNSTYSDIYWQTVSGANLTAKEDSIISNIALAIDTVRATNAIRTVLMDLNDPGPWVTAAFPDPVRRGYVTASINRVNSRLADLVAARENIVLSPWSAFYTNLFGSYGYSGTPYVSYVIGGETILMTGMNYEPHYMVMTDAHIGTVTMGIMAKRLVRDILNNYLNCDLPDVSDANILSMAGL